MGSGVLSGGQSRVTAYSTSRFVAVGIAIAAALLVSVAFARAAGR
jgi:hypothetical protein